MLFYHALECNVSKSIIMYLPMFADCGHPVEFLINVAHSHLDLFISAWILTVVGM